jgi:hypothetical protein
MQGKRFGRCPPDFQRFRERLERGSGQVKRPQKIIRHRRPTHDRPRGAAVSRELKKKIYRNKPDSQQGRSSGRRKGTRTRHCGSTPRTRHARRRKVRRSGHAVTLLCQHHRKSHDGSRLLGSRKQKREKPGKRDLFPDVKKKKKYDVFLRSRFSCSGSWLTTLFFCRTTFCLGIRVYQDTTIRLYPPH